MDPSDCAFTIADENSVRCNKCFSMVKVHSLDDLSLFYYHLDTNCGRVPIAMLKASHMVPPSPIVCDVINLKAKEVESLPPHPVPTPIDILTIQLPGGVALEFKIINGQQVQCGMCDQLIEQEEVSKHLQQTHADVLFKSRKRATAVAASKAAKDVSVSPPKIPKKPGPKPAIRPCLEPSTRSAEKEATTSSDSKADALRKFKTNLRKALGRDVPVTFPTPRCAKCGICSMLLSLGTKDYDYTHVVRHYKSWHATHDCAGTWGKGEDADGRTQLNAHDFAFVGTQVQCIRCGTFTPPDEVGSHFAKEHDDDIAVPKCCLCLAEVVLNAKVSERFGEGLVFAVLEERRVRCEQCKATLPGESAIEKHIADKHADLVPEEKQTVLKRAATTTATEGEPTTTPVVRAVADGVRGPSFSNTKLELTRKGKRKRNRTLPMFHQAVPENSPFVEQVESGAWRCKLCGEDIMAALLSVGAIKHFTKEHEEHCDDLQEELCKARIDKVTNGCMWLVQPKVFECALCDRQYVLHRHYNLCHVFRHMRTHHPLLVPEALGAEVVSAADGGYDFAQSEEELCKLRLAKICQGNIEFVDPRLVNCHACGDQTFSLSGDFNLMRVLRHLRAHHPDLIPANITVVQHRPLASTLKKEARLMMPPTAAALMYGGDVVLNEPASLQAHPTVEATMAVEVEAPTTTFQEAAMLIDNPAQIPQGTTFVTTEDGRQAVLIREGDEIQLRILN